MPLLPGSSDEVVSENIREMIRSGHPEKQAVAAALHHAGRTKHKKKPVKRPSLGPMHAFNSRNAPHN